MGLVRQEGGGEVTCCSALFWQARLASGPQSVVCSAEKMSPVSVVVVVVVVLVVAAPN